MAKYSTTKSFWLLTLTAMILFGSCSSRNTQTLFRSSSEIDLNALRDIYVVNDQGQYDEYYRIKEGDVIAIRNLQNKSWGGNSSQPTISTAQSNVASTNTTDQTSISYIVDNNGMVTLPALKDKVKVTGLTRTEARQKIEDLYDLDNLADPIIELNIVNLKVSLLGEFTNQGNYNLTKDNTTLLDILSEAGGLPKTADPRSLKIIRGRETIHVNLTTDAIIGNRKLILQNNDIITVSPNKNSLNGEKIQRFNTIVQPILVIVNLAILIFTLSK